MEQLQKLLQMISSLEDELPDWQKLPTPADENSAFRLWRSLVNVRPPKPIGADYLRVQDDYLQEHARRNGVVLVEDTEDFGGSLYLYRGDITRLAADGIVNAANSGMTGCYQPGHHCIDNCIHTFAGVQLREECGAQMRRQGHAEPTGQAKITGAYNLPAKYVLHTVGPIVDGDVTARDAALLAGCYNACLSLAAENGLTSLAFCCISTGVFHFPHRQAAHIAVDTVRTYLAAHPGCLKVVFNVFNDLDYTIYQELLSASQAPRSAPDNLPY